MLCEESRILLLTNMTTTKYTNYPCTPNDPRSFPLGFIKIEKLQVVYMSIPKPTAVMTHDVKIPLPKSSSMFII